MILVTTPGNVRTQSHPAARSRSCSPATRTRSPGCGPVAEIAALIDEGDATVDDYRALQKRIGTSRNVIVQPSTYGTENAPTLYALVAFGPSARAVVVVDTTVTDAELKRMHGLGAHGIRFNLAQAGATTPEMIEPLSKRVNELGWHIQINASTATITEIMPILQKAESCTEIVPRWPTSLFDSSGPEV